MLYVVGNMYYLVVKDGKSNKAPYGIFTEEAAAKSFAKFTDSIWVTTEDIKVTPLKSIDRDHMAKLRQ